MSIEASLVERAELHYAGIPVEAPLSEWGRVNALIPEVYGWLAARGAAPLGGPIYRYRRVGDAARPFSLEVAVPVAEPLAGDGRIEAGSLPAGEYAVAVHRGHPDGLARSLAALRDWVAAEGREPALEGDAGELWAGRYEWYLTDPEQEPDPGRWTTEIGFLLAP